MASNRPLYTFRPTQEPHQARLTIDTQARSPHKISPYLTGKFCEHLWSNICHGMHAQILHNPTFAEWVFAGAGNRPDGGVKFQCDEERQSYCGHKQPKGCSREPQDRRLSE